MFEGLSVAMVTPLRGGAIDWDATARLVDWMIDGGVQGLVVSGSTGEAATTSHDERRQLLAFVKERAKGRVWIVAGTGTNNTAESIVLTRMAEDVGVDGAMVVTPYYNKPTPKGQAAHFAAVARSTRLPVILYNVPGRTATNTTPGVIAAAASVVHDRSAPAIGCGSTHATTCRSCAPAAASAMARPMRPDAPTSTRRIMRAPPPRPASRPPRAPPRGSPSRSRARPAPAAGAARSRSGPSRRAGT